VRLEADASRFLIGLSPALPRTAHIRRRAHPVEPAFQRIAVPARDQLIEA
jgi:hypothetical protein